MTTRKELYLNGMTESYMRRMKVDNQWAEVELELPESLVTWLDAMTAKTQERFPHFTRNDAFNACLKVGLDAFNLGLDALDRGLMAEPSQNAKEN